jgi:hypothetical protein
MSIALAGRRVDAPDAPRRFPPEQVEAVRERIRDALQRHPADTLVAPAACGVDLLALEVAGDWGVLYDRICDDAEAQGDLIVLGARATLGEQLSTL